MMSESTMPAEISQAAPATGTKKARWTVQTPYYGVAAIYDHELKGYVWISTGQFSTLKRREREAETICKALNEERLKPMPILDMNKYQGQ